MWLIILILFFLVSIYLFSMFLLFVYRFLVRASSKESEILKVLEKYGESSAVLDLQDEEEDL